MHKIEEKNIIKIQRYYRSKKISNIWKKIILLFDLNNIENRTFYQFTILLKNKNLILEITKFLNKLDLIKEIKISSKIFLTSFLIYNFSNELLGIDNNRNILDKQIFEWSQTFNTLFIELLNKDICYYKIKKIINFINNYNLIFLYWKDFDKDNTINNIIFSYYNKKEHIKYIESKEEITENEINTINYLSNICETLISNIIIIDKNFDTDYFENNYELIYNNIKLNIEKVTNEISNNYKKAYLDILIKEFKENKHSVFNLINETNKRLINIVKNEKRIELKKAIELFNFTNILLKDDWSEELNLYIKIIANYIDNSNNVWKNYIFSLSKNHYVKNFPRILLEFNLKLDKLK